MRARTILAGMCACSVVFSWVHAQQLPTNGSVESRLGKLELENRAVQLQVWREPFVNLSAPMLCNLRRDPFEKAQESANNYNDWYIDSAFVLVPLQGVASKFLMTLKEFPPTQKPDDWSLHSLETQVKGMTKGD